MDNKIDFVITWVDESDPKWRKEFEYYSSKETRYINTDACRYRDWGTLRYWFRGVEKFAPWVNKIYFVTYGHLPKWLNTDNPKLVIVKHEDYIPAEYLPTFNSFTIEFFFHKIKGLSNRFVYFNDDMYLIDSVSPERFFRNGLPCDIGQIACMNHSKPDMFDSSVFLATALINLHFDKKTAIHNNLWKWYSPVYPSISINNFHFRKFSKFPGFKMNHLPQGYLRQTYEEVWDCCEEHLLRTCSDKFRSYGNIAHWLVRYWQLASGRFTPYDIFKDGKYYDIKDTTIIRISTLIIYQKIKLICLNDTPIQMDYDNNKKQILDAFDAILPDKCSFER
jgi:hypothetical protein